jgi:hypothetical protein
MGHWAGGIARGGRSGVDRQAGGLRQTATLENIMKIIDVPQSGKLGTFISFRTRFGHWRHHQAVCG